MGCMNRKVGTHIGSFIGRMIQVDVSVDDVGWGSFLRVRVVIDFHKPLACEHLINMNSSHLWITLL